jgi:molybdopterin synthase catalytic subunit
MTAPSWRSSHRPPVAELPQLTRAAIDPVALTTAVATPADGAVASFVGVVRDNHGEREVLWLEYEAHEEMAQKQLAALIDEARRRWPVGRVAIQHRLGRLDIGEVSVAIAVAAPHRAEALEACRWLIDTLKAEVPIFKKETYTDGEGWVEEDA